MATQGRSRIKSGQAKRLETLNTKTEKLKRTFLENLGKSAIVQLACERTGIGRSTYYDWQKTDEVFAKAANLAMKLGGAVINDMAESQLLRLIQKGSITAIIFWLKNHHSGYGDKMHHEHEIVETDLSPEERIAIAKALFNAGQFTKYGRDSMIRAAGGTPPDVPGEEEFMEEVLAQAEEIRLENLKKPPSLAKVVQKVNGVTIPIPLPKQKRKGVMNIAEFAEQYMKTHEK